MPRRGFVAVAFREQPYQSLVADLALETHVVDDTDVNCDVCFSLRLGADGLVLLRLSMVGPYAMVEADRGSGRADLVASQADCRTDLEHFVIKVLMHHGLLPLSWPRLAVRVDLALPDVGEPTVYNALFAPEDDFTRVEPEPW